MTNMTQARHFIPSLIRTLVVVLCCWAPGSVVSAAEQTIPLWTYYSAPPFITGEGEGLSHDFTRLLNRRLEGRYRFELQLMPRTRIDRNLSEGLAGTVLFVNWAWMGDKQKTKYHWSREVLSDRNEVVSRQHGRAPTQILFSGPESLKGLVFGGELGRKYKGLEEAFSSGLITRRDARREEQNLDMLVKGRIDVTSASSTFLRYKVLEKGLQGQVYFSPQPLFSYTRHLLITPPLAKILPEINSTLDTLQSDPEWHAIKARYGVQ